MAEKKKKSEEKKTTPTSSGNSFFSKENFVAYMLGTGGNFFKDWIQSSEGKASTQRIMSRILGIGPGDEALFEKAITFLLDQILQLDRENKKAERKEVRKKIKKFIDDLEKNGYSFWWFRNVLAKMKEGDAQGENQAAQTLAEIITADSFEEAKTMFSETLLRKTYLSRISESEGWEIIKHPSGSLEVLVDSSKINLNRGVSWAKNTLRESKAEVKRGFIRGLVWFWGSVTVLAVIFYCFF